MDSKNSFDEKTMIDNNLSNRYIDLDPNGYFIIKVDLEENKICLLYTSPSPRDRTRSRMPSSA